MHLNQNLFLAGQPVLTSILGIGEGHLLDQKALQVKSQHFPKREALFGHPYRGW